MRLEEILCSKHRIAILNCLKQPTEVSTSLEIALEIEVPLEVTEKNLKRLVEAGLIQHDGGYYGITLKGIGVMKSIKKCRKLLL